MKKVYKGKFDTPKKVIKDKKKQSAAYILLGFFAFVFIGSILGIIAFFRTNKKDESAFNVVSASANVVNDMWAQGSTNETSVFVKGPLYMHDHIIINNGYSLEVINDTNQEYEEDFDGFFPFYNYLYDGIEDADELFIAFSINKGDDWLFELNTYPYIVLQYFDENENVINTVGFDMAVNQHSAVYGIVYTMHYKKPTFDYNSAFFMISYPDYGDVEFVFDRFFIEDVQVKEMPSFNGYAYTYNQMQDIYMQEIADAYHDGLSQTDGYQTGFDDGYNQAVDEYKHVLNGILYQSNVYFKFVNNDGTTALDWTLNNTYHTDKYFPLSYAVQAVALNSGVGFTQFFYTRFEVREDLPLLSGYTFDFGFGIEQGDNITADNIGLNLTIITNLNEYSASIIKVDDYHFQYFVDMSAALSQEYIVSVVISGYSGSIWNYNLRVSSFNSYYDVGYRAGFLDAYAQFRDEFDIQFQEEYQIGFHDGRRVGYDEGFNEGAELSGNFTFTSLIGAVVDVPIKAFTSLFNFEILGVNLANFFFALFTMMLVLAVIKFLI